MRQNDIAVMPHESAIVLKPANSRPVIANADGSIDIRRDSIPLLIAVLAEQLAGQHVSSVGEQRHANAALKALRAYLKASEDRSTAGHAWV